MRFVIYEVSQDRFISEYVKFPLSVSFHYNSIIHLSITDVMCSWKLTASLNNTLKSVLPKFSLLYSLLFVCLFNNTSSYANYITCIIRLLVNTGLELVVA
jgi:hypothetical protein